MAGFGSSAQRRSVEGERTGGGGRESVRRRGRVEERTVELRSRIEDSIRHRDSKRGLVGSGYRTVWLSVWLAATAWKRLLMNERCGWRTLGGQKWWLVAGGRCRGLVAGPLAGCDVRDSSSSSSSSSATSVGGRAAHFQWMDGLDARRRRRRRRTGCQGGGAENWGSQVVSGGLDTSPHWKLCIWILWSLDSGLQRAAARAARRGIGGASRQWPSALGRSPGGVLGFASRQFSQFGVRRRDWLGTARPPPACLCSGFDSVRLLDDLPLLPA